MNRSLTFTFAVGLALFALSGCAAEVGPEDEAEGATEALTPQGQAPAPLIMGADGLARNERGEVFVPVPCGGEERGAVEVGGQPQGDSTAPFNPPICTNIGRGFCQGRCPATAPPGYSNVCSAVRDPNSHRPDRVRCECFHIAPPTRSGTPLT